MPKKTRRLANINSVVLSLYSRGMTTCNIEAPLEEVYGAKVSQELISNITEVVVDEVKAWQSRPLDEGRFPAIVANPGWMGLRCLGMRRTRCLPVSSADTSN